MSLSDIISRRDFLERAGAVGATALLASMGPAIASAAAAAADARTNGTPLRVLTEAEAALLDAVTAQIIPSGDGLPGAREAGIVHFLDRAFETFMAEGFESVREGLKEFETSIMSANPGAESFAGLSEEGQAAAMPAFAETQLFGIIRFLTLAGMFATPSYGGNNDKAGWELIGFEDRHVWQPPFGYYDAEEIGK